MIMNDDNDDDGDLRQWNQNSAVDQFATLYVQSAADKAKMADGCKKNCNLDPHTKIDKVNQGR